MSLWMRTINPDFSQVESDAFQVQVNQRFPIFFSEKRPFFMEGMGLFNIAGTGGDGNMRTAVHTRRIVNPIWGTKLTGTAGKMTFGLLNALDQTPEDVGNRGQLRDRAEQVVHDWTRNVCAGAVGLHRRDRNRYGTCRTPQPRRGRRPLDQDSHRRSSFQQLFWLRRPASHQSNGTHATGSQISYSYNTRRISWANQVEHYGRDFQMDTAFYNRTGFTSGWSYGEVNIYPKEGGNLVAASPSFLLDQTGTRSGSGRQRGIRQYRRSVSLYPARLPKRIPRLGT